jgi:hypothetical protein
LEKKKNLRKPAVEKELEQRSMMGFGKKVVVEGAKIVPVS